MTKSDDAYRTVRERILDGELAPGQVLQQRELAAALGISTTPLREALRRLMTEGLVEIDSHRDARISDLRAEQARDLVEVRMALDPLAASLAAQRRTAQDLVELRSALDDLEPLTGRASVDDLTAHRRFHRAVHTAAHNDLLAASLEQLWDQSDRYRLFALSRDDERPPADHRDAKTAEHRALVDAIADRDADRAASIMSGHIGTSLGARAARRLGQDVAADAASAGS